MDVQDVFGDVPDLFLPEDGTESLGRGAGQNAQRPPQRQPGVPVILGALVAAAVGAVVLQKAVQAVGGLADGVPPLLLADVGQQKKAQQHVLGAPAGPVAHGLVPVAHPPEVVPEVGRQDAGADLPLHPGGKARVGLLQLGAQEIVDGGQQSPRLGGEQVDQGPGGVGQRQLGGVPHIGIVGRQLPGALLADGPHRVGDGVQKAALVFHALGGGQGAQPGPAGKAGFLPFGPLPGAGKVQPEGQGQGGQGFGCLGGAGGHQPLFGGGGQGLPPGPVMGGRARPERGQHLRQKGQAFRDHGAPPQRFCWYSRGLKPVDFLKTLEK